MDVKKILQKVFDYTQNIIISVFVIMVCWLLFRFTTYASFHIPSNSMEPSILVGDQVIVNKWIIGGRFIKVWDNIKENEELIVRRLPGMRKIRRNDLLVFNFPYPGLWDSLGFSLKTSYYIKRCTALPGDTFEIRNARYLVYGCDYSLGNVESQEMLAELVTSGRVYDMGIVMKGYPYMLDIGWDIMNFGPLYIPKAGDTIRMDRMAYILYRHVIEWEQKQKLRIEDDEFYLGDNNISEYTFKTDCYFVTGDNVLNSQDSRYWGLLPEPFILGVATRIGKSVSPVTDKIRWDRVLKKITL
jgi:signal peptidase I